MSAPRDPGVETTARRIPDRPAAEGRVPEPGSKHGEDAHPAKPGMKIMVPRHRELEPGTARSIPKAAGWI